VLGFDVEDAIACSEAVGELAQDRLEKHMASARDSAGEFREDHPAYTWASTTLQGWQDAGLEDIRAFASPLSGP
jgi:hypothetical protein